MHREEIEDRGKPKRLVAARIKAGHYPTLNIFAELISYEAVHKTLEKVGCPRGLTEEKRLGLYVRPNILDTTDPTA